MEKQENLVTVVGWPKEPASLEHRFEKPCPVLISFDQGPATVLIQSGPERPFNVNMNMSLFAREPIPLCIKVCEPICARSDYEVGITIFGNPFASITVKGQTRFFNCKEEG